MLNPANLEFPEELAAIGRMVIGYSELDLGICHASGLILNNRWSVLAALHSLRQEAARLDIIEHLTRAPFAAAGLGAEFEETLQSLKHCRSIRNKYAHATWNIDDTATPHVLLFADITNTDWTNAKPKFVRTSLVLIQAQEAFFDYTKGCVLFLETRAKGQSHQSMPPKIPQPLQHLGP